MAIDYIDPFGAQEFLITGVKREMVCTDLMRMSCYAVEDGQQILRVKLLIPLQMLIIERHKLALFMSEVTAGRVLM